MLEQLIYIEDAYTLLTDKCFRNAISYQPQDHKPLLSFHTIISNGDQLTEPQGRFVLILLNKYKKQLENITGSTLDLDKLIWKNEFRIIDRSKTLMIGKNDNGYPYAFVKFPYILKDSFDEEFNGEYRFGPVSKCREVPLLSVNPLALLDWCNKNDFTIDSQFIDYVENVEEVWANEQSIVPYSIIKDNDVKLVNAIKTSEEYFLKNKNHNIDQDVFLARQLGFPLLSDNNDPLYTICSNIEHSNFWTNDMSVLADILAKLDLDKVVIVLDRQSNVQSFIEELIDNLKKQCYNIDNIRVCFRGANDNIEGKEFNKWIKMKGIGGKIESGKLFIFKHTVAKWAKNLDFSPQLMVSNCIYEPTNISTRNFLKSCHATITVSDTVPAMRKENKIVKL